MLNTKVEDLIKQAMVDSCIEPVNSGELEKLSSEDTAKCLYALSDRLDKLVAVILVR